MKINITKKQYIDLITMSCIANDVMGILGDYIEDKPYKEQSNRAEALESYLLTFAKDFECDNFVEEWEGKMYTSPQNSDSMVR